jgi:DNA-binding XRE family transcriptional regulator
MPHEIDGQKFVGQVPVEPEEEREQLEEFAQERVDAIMDFLSRTRKEMDITQADMGEALGIGQRSVSDLESSPNPGLRRVIEYAQVLGFTMTPVLEDLAQDGRADGYKFGRDA